MALVIAVVCLFESSQVWGEESALQKADEAEFVALAPEGRARFETTARERQVPRQFRQEDHEFSYQATLKRSRSGVRVYDVTFPSPIQTEIEENNTVHCEYYQPAGEGPFPGVVVLHILGGSFSLSQGIANSLAREGVAALFIKMPYYGERRSKNSSRRMISQDVGETVAGMTQAVLDIRRGAAWLAARPEIDTERLGITGISLGGIMTALSAAAEPRFEKVAIYLAGGDFAEEIWNADHPEMQEFRSQWIEKGGDRESFYKAVAPIDPVTYGHLLKNRQVLMVAAKNDEIISTRSTLALWQAIGKRPELVWLDSGHVSAFRYLFGEMERMKHFFGKTTADAAPVAEQMEGG